MFSPLLSLFIYIRSLIGCTVYYDFRVSQGIFRVAVPSDTSQLHFRSRSLGYHFAYRIIHILFLNVVSALEGTMSYLKLTTLQVMLVIKGISVHHPKCRLYSICFIGVDSYSYKSRKGHVQYFPKSCYDLISRFFDI